MPVKFSFIDRVTGLAVDRHQIECELWSMVGFPISKLEEGKPWTASRQYLEFEFVCVMAYWNGPYDESAFDSAYCHHEPTRRAAKEVMKKYKFESCRVGKDD